MNEFIAKRAATSVDIAKSGGELALSYFKNLSTIHIEKKGHQDFVSEADKNVELHVRRELERAFPDDTIVGEEGAPKQGTSGFTWVIDPIDGTTNFINAIPQWAVVIAGVYQGKVVTGVIHDPCHGESFCAQIGQGAMLNETRLDLAGGPSINEGSIGIGYSSRASADHVLNLISGIVEQGGMFQRNGSGALSLAYVAAGRLLGFAEEHMNAWDCLAGQLIVAEAGGGIEDQNADDMIVNGGRVIAANPTVYPQLLSLFNAACPA